MRLLIKLLIFVVVAILYFAIAWLLFLLVLKIAIGLLVTENRILIEQVVKVIGFVKTVEVSLNAGIEMAKRW